MKEFGVPSKDSIRKRMKRSTRDLLATAVEENHGPAQHFPRRFAREGEQKDVLRSDTALDQIRYAVDDRPGLPRSRAGDNEMRTVGRAYGLILRIVQFPPIVDRQRVRGHEPERVWCGALEEVLFHGSYNDRKGLCETTMESE